MYWIIQEREYPVQTSLPYRTLNYFLIHQRNMCGAAKMFEFCTSPTLNVVKYYTYRRRCCKMQLTYVSRLYEQQKANKTGLLHLGYCVCYIATAVVGKGRLISTKLPAGHRNKCFHRVTATRRWLTGPISGNKADSDPMMYSQWASGILAQMRANWDLYTGTWYTEQLAALGQLTILIMPGVKVNSSSDNNAREACICDCWQQWEVGSLLCCLRQHWKPGQSAHLPLLPAGHQSALSPRVFYSSPHSIASTSIKKNIHWDLFSRLWCSSSDNKRCVCGWR